MEATWGSDSLPRLLEGLEIPNRPSSESGVGGLLGRGPTPAVLYFSRTISSVVWCGNAQDWGGGLSLRG